MNKAPLLTALVALALVLTACGSSSPNGFSNGGSRAITLSPAAKLALGTIKLEGSRQAVDAKAAAKLIPLWQLMVQLNSSGSSAPQEVSAVMDQIKATMTPAQLNTIDGMQLSSADLFTLLQQEAQQSQSGGGSGANGSGASGTGGRNGRVFVFGGGGPGGGFGGGGFGGGGFGGAGGRTTNGTGTGSTTQETAAQQAQAAQARQNAISDVVINQLVRLLQTKLSSQPG